MKNFDPEAYKKRRTECLECCFRAFVENGFENTGVQLLSKYCGFKTNQALYHYFSSKEQVVSECVDYALKKLEKEFMKKIPTSRDDLKNYFDTFPKWAAQNYSDHFRLVYQVYSSPKFKEEGESFFRNVPQRYDGYVKDVAQKLDISVDLLKPIAYLYITALMHYILFKDDVYFNVEIEGMYNMLQMIFDNSNKL